MTSYKPEKEPGIAEGRNLTYVVVVNPRNDLSAAHAFYGTVVRSRDLALHHSMALNHVASKTPSETMLSASSSPSRTPQTAAHANRYGFVPEVIADAAADAM
jgi:hypothetical protein